MKRVLLTAIVILALGGCATREVAWISSSRFDHRDYHARTVAVLPLLIAGPAQFESVPPRHASQVQRALANQLSVLQLSKVEEVENEQPFAVGFPYTPERLAKFGQERGFDAVVGATMLRISRRTLRRQWTMTGSITFVDARDPTRHWTIAKTWDFVGDLGTASAAIQLSAAFQRDFLKVRRASAGRNDGTVVSLDTVEATLDEANQAVQRVSADIGSQEGQNFTYIDVFAIDDRGLSSVEVFNQSTGERKLVWGEAAVIKRPFPFLAERAQVSASAEQIAGGSAGGLPIYFADRVPVRLVKGPNEIVATAVNRAGRFSRQAVRLNADVSQNQPVEMMVIAPTEFLPGTEAALKLDAAANSRLSELQADEWASRDGTHRSYAYIGKDATRNRVLRGVTEDWARGDDGTRRVLAFVGRAEMVDGRPYLLMHDTEIKYPDEAAISVREFLELTHLGIQRVTLDLCTSPKRASELRRSISSYVGPADVAGVPTFGAVVQQAVARETILRDGASFDFHVEENCQNPIGAKFLAVANQELGGGERTHP